MATESDAGADAQRSVTAAGDTSGTPPADASGTGAGVTTGAAEEAPKRISPWWLLGAALAAGLVLTALADLVPGGEKLSAVEWLGTTVGVAALVVAVGIYRLQDRSAAEAHRELMDQLEAQNELLNEFAERATSRDEDQEEVDALNKAARAEIERRYGEGSIASAIDPGRGRGGRGTHARLVRLTDGRLLSVYDRDGRLNVREISDRRARPGGLDGKASRRDR